MKPSYSCLLTLKNKNMPSIDNYYILDRFIDTRALGFSARVISATNMCTGDDVAFKILRREHLTSLDVWERFVIESRLSHLDKERITWYPGVKETIYYVSVQI